MKLKLLVLSLIFCLTVVSGCGGSSDSGPASDESAAPAASEGNAASPSSSKSTDFVVISDFADAWNEAYKQNEAAINSYDGVIMELAMPGMEFISGVQYDLLNMENENGRFEGELMMAGFPGFIEKDGPKLTFGYDYIRDEAGFSPSLKEGDRIVENGQCDLAEETYQTETFTERNGEIVRRGYSEFKRLENKEMICLVITSYSVNSRDEAELFNDCTYIKAGKDKFDFVIGKAAQGTDFEKLTFIDKNDLTKDEARQMMEAAGYVIEQSGGIADGTLFVD